MYFNSPLVRHVIDRCLVSAANLVDSKLRLFIFGCVPMAVKLKTMFAPAMGTSQEAVMAPAVADSSKLGYAKLYRLMLDYVSLPLI